MTNNYIPDSIAPAWPASIADGDVRAKLLELLGVEEPTEVDFTIESEERKPDGATVSRLRFANVLGDTVPGMLVQPSNAADGSCTAGREPKGSASSEALSLALPGVVCLPGTSGTAERMVHSHFHQQTPGRGPLIGWARELARRGFATLSLTLKGCEERRGALEDWERTSKLLAPLGRPLMGVQVDEALRGIRVLAAHAGIDVGNIGLTGMSLGGNTTLYAMACAPWIRAAAPVCGGVGSMDCAIRQGDAERHSSYFYVPHLLRFFDHADIVRACILPRPFLAVAPRRDEDMPSSGVDRLVQQVAPAYAAAGAGKNFEVRRPDMNHVFQPEYFEWVVEWFKKHLVGKGK